MNTMNPKGGLPVMFRKWPDGGIIAIFPTLLGAMDPYTCSMYEHIGQHGAGEPQGVIQRTRKATASEYRDLLRELHKIGYRNLVVYDRYQHGWLEDRRKALKKMEGGNPVMVPTQSAAQVQVQSYDISHMNPKLEKGNWPAHNVKAIVNNVNLVFKTRNIDKLNGAAYKFIIAHMGFIAHYNLYGFRGSYEFSGLEEFAEKLQATEMGRDYDYNLNWADKYERDPQFAQWYGSAYVKSVAATIRGIVAVARKYYPGRGTRRMFNPVQTKVKGISMTGAEYRAFANYLNAMRVQSFTARDVSKFLHMLETDKGFRSSWVNGSVAAANPKNPVYATMTNLRKYQGRPGLVMYSPHTQERYSADLGDYFWAPPGHRFKDSTGHVMILGESVPSTVKSLNPKKR